MKQRDGTSVAVYLEDDPFIRFIATGIGCAVEIATCVQGQTRIGICPVRRPREAMEHALLAGCIQFENGSIVGVAAFECGAVKVPQIITDQPAIGICPVGRPREAIEHALLAGCIHHVHGSVVGSTSPVRSAVEISRLVQDQASIWICSVRFPGESMQHGFSPVTALYSRRSQFKHRPFAGWTNPSLGSGAVKIAISICD